MVGCAGSVGSASVLGGKALALLCLLRPQFRRQVRAEVLGLEHAAVLDLLAALLERGAADPLDRLLDGLHLPQPEARAQLLGLGERAIRHGALPPSELAPHA